MKERTYQEIERAKQQREAFYNRLRSAGVPPRFLDAHISNCKVYAGASGKLNALNRATEMIDTGAIHQDGYDRFALALIGEYGTGKTWLATATFKALMARNYADADAENGGMWRKYYDMVREVQATYSPGATETSHDVLRRFQRTPILVLDDVGDLDRSAETADRQRLLYEVLDYRNDHFLPTLLTTNLGTEDLIEQFGERTYERIREMAALVSMRGVNYRHNPDSLTQQGG